MGLQCSFVFFSVISTHLQWSLLVPNKACWLPEVSCDPKHFVLVSSDDQQPPVISVFLCWSSIISVCAVVTGGLCWSRVISAALQCFPVLSSSVCWHLWFSSGLLYSATVFSNHQYSLWVSSGHQSFFPSSSCWFS